MNKILSIIIPVYNEKDTILTCINNVLKSDTLDLKKEIIVSDNNSNDGTREILKNINKENVKILFQDHNKGKGSNIKNALKHATGDIIVFQDADLEYSPNDYPELLQPFFNAEADVVYGTRLTGAKVTKILGFPNLLGNKIITFVTNLLYNRIFTDIATGYKLFKREVIDNLDLKSNGFEIEPEITAKISKNKKLNIYETPISIYSRRYDEGKKVRWWDFFVYIYTLIKYRF